MPSNYIKVICFPTDGDPHEEAFPLEKFLDHCNEYLGGYVANVQSTREPDKVLLVDEDAAFKSKARNTRASLHYIHTYVYGPALLVDRDEWTRVMEYDHD